MGQVQDDGRGADRGLFHACQTAKGMDRGPARAAIMGCRTAARVAGVLVAVERVAGSRCTVMEMVGIMAPP